MKMFDYTCSNMPSSNNIAYMQIFTHASFYKKLKKDYRKKLSNVYINRTHPQASCFAFSLQFVKTAFILRFSSISVSFNVPYRTTIERKY